MNKLSNLNKSSKINFYAKKKYNRNIQHFIIYFSFYKNKWICRINNKRLSFVSDVNEFMIDDNCIYINNNIYYYLSFKIS